MSVIQQIAYIKVVALRVLHCGAGVRHTIPASTSRDDVSATMMPRKKALAIRLPSCPTYPCRMKEGR